MTEKYLSFEQIRNPKYKALVIVLYDLKRQGQNPTMRQLGGLIGIKSKNNVSFMVDKLAQFGLINKGPFRTKCTLTLTPEGEKIARGLLA